ncbi:phosphonate C-P lyase system protein PhnL [Undibacterium sp. TS12]|uniref:phosphonate C-P lyase system protein PhnL n=1 Tax=Undibacterium sp. TS12 TaxID=2908202 RepID=UPI001F4CE39C|nr:phosphonate C-P lyase system protein PhnL [Undibacterium sp. TS12]MCH8617813.1 phosphonate C-P lyase system protein PhnL [Undibacterium sp. TS12]
MLRRIEVQGLSKDFTLHLQGGQEMSILQNIDMQVDAGECVVIHAPSGAGKSTLLRCLYANYRASSGSVNIWHDNAWVDVQSAAAQQVLAVRHDTLGFVTQFLRVIPRISTVDLVAEPLVMRGVEKQQADERAEELLVHLRIPKRLWHIPPATFSGGEQQRVNIARTMIYDYPILLLDEPTASLDEANRATVINMINAARERGAAIVGIFHDEAVRQALATRIFSIPAAQSVNLVAA